MSEEDAEKIQHSFAQEVFEKFQVSLVDDNIKNSFPYAHHFFKDLIDSYCDVLIVLGEVARFETHSYKWDSLAYDIKVSLLHIVWPCNQERTRRRGLDLEILIPQEFLALKPRRLTVHERYYGESRLWSVCILDNPDLTELDQILCDIVSNRTVSGRVERCCRIAIASLFIY